MWEGTVGTGMAMVTAEAATLDSNRLDSVPNPKPLAAAAAFHTSLLKEARIRRLLPSGL